MTGRPPGRTSDLTGGLFCFTGRTAFAMTGTLLPRAGGLPPYGNYCPFGGAAAFLLGAFPNCKTATHFCWEYSDGSPGTSLRSFGTPHEFSSYMPDKSMQLGYVQRMAP